MKELKEAWKKYAAKIDALSQRERIVVFGATIFVVAFIMNQLFIDSSAKRIAALNSQMQQQQNDMNTLQPQLRELERLAADPEAAARTRRDSLQQQVAAVSETIKDVQQDLVPAQKMNELLQDMLSRNPRLQLVSMRTLPVTTLAGEAPATSPAANAAPIMNHVASSGDNIYKHGVEITLQGSYADLHDYLLRLERLPLRMFWARAQLGAEDYPRLTLKVTVYTLSLDKTWLEV
jgi:MSHA biogenesis protein MshJ